MPKYVSGVKQSGLLPEGNYKFVVTAASLQRSRKTEAEMIRLELGFVHHGVSVLVFDYLVFDGSAFSNSWIDSFRRSLGETILEGEEVELLPASFVNKSGKAHLITEEWDGRSRNKVDAYLDPK